MLKTCTKDRFLTDQKQTCFFSSLFLTFVEPSDAGIIPPEYRRSFQGAQAGSRPQPNLPDDSPSQAQSSEKKGHQFSQSPVEEWAKEQVP